MVLQADPYSNITPKICLDSQMHQKKQRHPCDTDVQRHADAEILYKTPDQAELKKETWGILGAFPSNYMNVAPLAAL